MLFLKYPWKFYIFLYFQPRSPGFSLLWGWRRVRPHQPKVCSFPTPHLEKFLSSRLFPTPIPILCHQIFIPQPTKSQFPPPPPINNNFSSYNPIKTAFLAVVITPVPFCFNFIIFGHLSHATFDLN